MTIEQARAFAEAAHAGQTRKNAAKDPYVTHPAEVAALVSGAGGSTAAIMAAWLHDTVEDCEVSTATLAGEFGVPIAGLVGELTDDKSLPKHVRKEQQIAHAPDLSAEAALVKIADKLSNVRCVAVDPPVGWSLQRRLAYLDWAEAVVQSLPAAADPLRPAFAAQLSAARAMLAGPDDARSADDSSTAATSAGA